MTDRFDTVWIVIDLLFAVGFGGATWLTDQNLSVRFVALGACIGVGERVVRERYDARFTDRPLRSIGVTLLWVVGEAIAFRRSDRFEQYSHGLGFSLASAVVRFSRR